MSRASAVNGRIDILVNNAAYLADYFHSARQYRHPVAQIVTVHILRVRVRLLRDVSDEGEMNIT